ncbi:MAG: succinate dehydrogenase cytochrome b subunit [Bacteroidota bacterium]|jgi:succinate dehydrogenase (or fumarate reductase) cytochrome b subunit, b558 family|nr:succinate dehydrogenase cytochrome b subunit [Bacteroidota bacterium]
MSNIFCSSIGKKLLMSLAGIFLCVFLLVHLGINLMLLRNDGGEVFKLCVEFMTTNILIKIVEPVLFLAFLIHMIWAAILQVQNWMARPSKYAVTNHSQSSFFSKYMIHTGIIIFAFLVLHFVNFYFVKLGLTSPAQGVNPVEGEHDFYNMAINLFTQPVYSVIYIAFFIFLGFHFNHAFQSAFQTFGLNHKKYTPAIKFIGLAYSILVPAGFAIIPIYFMFFWK